jgi:ribonuclease-3
MGCSIEGLKPVQGQGTSRRKAEQIAAEKMLEVIMGTQS